MVGSEFHNKAYCCKVADESFSAVRTSSESHDNTFPTTPSCCTLSDEVSTAASVSPTHSPMVIRNNKRKPSIGSVVSLRSEGTLSSCSAESVDTAAMKLALGKRHARIRRLRISGPTSIVGVTLLVVGVTFYWSFPRQSSLYHVGCASLPLGNLSLFISLLRTDRRMIPCAARLCMVCLAANGLGGMFRTYRLHEAVGAGECFAYGRRVHCDWGYWSMACTSSNAIFRLGFAAYIFFRRKLSQARLLRLLWTTCGWFWIITAAFSWFAQSLGEWVMGIFGNPLGTCAQIILNLVVGLMFLNSSVRFKAQAWLASRGESATSAAAVSELIGGKRIDEVMALARGNFLCVPADRIIEEDLADSNPNPHLRKLTEHVSLGHVDAFVSHSWSDDPAKKWKMLQDWREAFKSRHRGREPKLWIDKYCIEQNNLDEELACLPVYLSYCRRVLALCGATYFDRLWCLAEIFIFMEMGGVPSNLELLPLDGRTQLDANIDALDLRSLRCSSDADTEKLQAVLEAGSDGVHGLVKFLKGVLTNAST